MKRLFSGLFIATSAAAMTAGAGVLTGVEKLLAVPKRSRRSLHVELDQPRALEAAKEEQTPSLAEVSPTPNKGAERNFSIKRTKSEVGYVYWILEGHGRYKCFVLCDSWDEAVVQAKARLAEIDGVDVNVAIATETLA